MKILINNKDTGEKVTEHFAPCGLICGLCTESHEGCKGCRHGGGDQNCFQLNCCKEKGIQGCWQCQSFPCDKGYFSDKEWRGVMLGFTRCLKEDGIEKFFSLVESALGNHINYKDYLSKTEQEIVDMLRSSVSQRAKDKDK